jgi:hypothetical protein
MDGKSLVVRIAGQKDNRGPRGSFQGHGDGGGDGDRVGALRGPHGTFQAGSGAAPPPPPGGCCCALGVAVFGCMRCVLHHVLCVRVACCIMLAWSEVGLTFLVCDASGAQQPNHHLATCLVVLNHCSHCILLPTLLVWLQVGLLLGHLGHHRQATGRPHRAMQATLHSSTGLHHHTAHHHRSILMVSIRL